jgi:shikimate kinase
LNNRFKTGFFLQNSITHSRIALIGYRCTGKSTIGELLASRLGFLFSDTDHQIETTHQQTIQQIFTLEGEASFRQKESNILKSILSSENHVIATGGGIILAEDNRDMLRSLCWIVWLQASPQTIWKRIQADQKSYSRRPNLTIGGLAEIEQVFQNRVSLYSEMSNFSISTEELSPEDLADRILAAWNLYK